ncbi:MAG: transcription termination/antitermination factor NusG [Clostridia bacterium]|nr:transcription termination/antitermination factor NusG [Clostridia bacterium]
MEGIENAKWYVLHTRSGYETLVKTGLEKLIENNNLGDTIFEIKIPMEQTIEEKNGKKKVVLRKRCPCYVFLKMIYKNELWFLITNTRGVTGFVGPMGHPAPLSDTEVQRMHLDETVKEGFELNEGENVKIVSGALDGFIGTVVSVNNNSQKAMVSVSVFGRDTNIEVDFVDLIKIEELPAQ